MSKQALIYENPRVVSLNAHRGVSVGKREDFRFAQGINAVPLAAGEFPFAAREFPIVFTGSGDQIAPAALLGLRDGDNLFVRDDGSWGARYIPAFLRRYPFVFVHDEAAATYTLCIDEASDRVNRNGIGSQLFEESGEATSYLKSMGDFLKDWEGSFGAARAFSAKLNQLDLLDARELSFTLPDGAKAVTRGFSTVDRERLHGLSGEQVKELLVGGQLELIHAHLLSLRSVDDLAKRIKPEERVLN